MEFSLADGVIFFIVFIFAFLAFLKGLVKDLFSTLNLIFATISSYAISPMVTDLIANGKYPQMLVDMGVRFVIFVVILILASIITSKISKPLNERIPSAINQSLGFGFGFAKGYFILAFIFSAFLSLYAKNSYEKIGPTWFQDSKSYDLLLVGSETLRPFTDDFINQIKGDSIEKFSSQIYDEKDILKSSPGTIQRIMEQKNTYEYLEKYGELPSEKKSEGVTEDEDVGYSDDQLYKLKRLIEIVQ